MPRSPTPTGQPTLAFIALTDVAFRLYNNVGPAMMVTFVAQSRGLLARCLRFAGWVTQHSTRLATRLLAKL